MLVSKILQS